MEFRAGRFVHTLYALCLNALLNAKKQKDYPWRLR